MLNSIVQQKINVWLLGNIKINDYLAQSRTRFTESLMLS